MGSKSVFKNICKKDNATLLNIAGLVFGVAYLFILLSFNIWLLVNGAFSMPAMHFFDFLTGSGGYTASQLGFEDWSVVAALIFMNLWLVVWVLISVRIFKKTWVDMRSSSLKASLGQPVPCMMYSVLAFVLVSEVLFRWIPLAVLYPLSGSGLVLFVTIAVSSVAYGWLYAPGSRLIKKRLVTVLPHMAMGIFLSFVFLYFGFLEAVLVHLGYNILITAFLGVEERVFKNKFKIAVQ